MNTLKTLTALVGIISWLGLLPPTTHAQAPDSIAGMGIQITLTSGTEPFGNSGTGTIRPWSNGTYTFVFNGETMYGSYTYSKSSARSGIIYMTDSYGYLQIVTINWSSFTNGTFRVTNPSYPGSYGSGPFVVTVRTLPGDVILLIPGDGSTSIERIPYFTWSQTDPASTWYHVYLQRNGSKCLEEWTQGIRGLDGINWTPSSALSSGSYTWWVQGWNSAGTGPWSQSFTFSIPSTAPGVLTPVFPNEIEITNSTVRYLWTADTNATWYQLCVIKGSDIFLNKWFSQRDSVTDPATGNFALRVGGHSMGTYSWWVRGWNTDGFGPWTSTCTFTVPDLKPGAVTLISPSGSQSKTSVIRFTWEVEPQAAWYNVCLVKDGKVMADEWCAASDSVIDIETGQFALDLPGHGGGNYQWWVRAWSPDGMGPWSSGMSFTVPVQTPAAANLLFPDGMVTETSPTFQWDAVEGAAWYCIWIQQGSAKYYSTWVNTNSWTPSWSLPNGNYQWWVQTWNEDGMGAWSSAMSFSRVSRIYSGGTLKPILRDRSTVVMPDSRQ